MGNHAYKNCVKIIAFVLLLGTPVCAQVVPGRFTTVKTTDVTAVSICVGCPVGSNVPADNSAITTAGVSLKSGTPLVTTNRLYNVAGALYFNGMALATGSSISGTTDTIPIFTGASTLGDGPLTYSGSTLTLGGTMAATAFTGSGTALTGVAKTASANALTGTQTITATSSTRPLVAFGSDGATSAIVASLYSNTSGRASALHFSDAFTYNLAIGSDLNGSFNIWSGRSPGTAGSSVFSVTSGGNTVAAGSLSVAGASTLTGNSTVGGTLGVSGALTAASLNGGLTTVTAVLASSFGNFASGVSVLQGTGGLALGTTAVMSTAGNGNIVMDGAVTSASTGPLVAANVTTGTGTAAIWNGSNILLKQTSSARYKEHMAPLVVSPGALSRFVALTPKFWDYKGQQNGAAGFIAEDLDNLGVVNAYGTSALVNYDSDGRPESNRDFAVMALQHLVIQQLEARVSALEAKLSALAGGTVHATPTPTLDGR